MMEFGDAGIDTGTIVLRTRTIQIPEVIVRAEAPIVQKGDTTEYLADAFRSSENATAEDLLQQLPGLRFTGGTIRVGTEEVSEILLNGLPISTSDPVTLLREIPAATIERVQVYERMSDEAEFSGFEDGDTRTTVNLVSRGGTRKISSGNMAGGFGESGRYEARASYMGVDGARRFMFSGNTQSSSGTGTIFLPMSSAIDIPGSSPPAALRLRTDRREHTHRMERAPPTTTRGTTGATVLTIDSRGRALRARSNGSAATLRRLLLGQSIANAGLPPHGRHRTRCGGDFK